MLFNSYPFLFLFLPVTLAVFFALGRRSHRLAVGFLALASLVFYAWWYPPDLALLLASAAFNYGMGVALARCRDPARQTGLRRTGLRRTWLLALAVGVDLAVLGYFKYAEFGVETALAVLGGQWKPPSVALPLGISFFTLTQIAFLVDTAQGKARDYDPVHYLVFVTYFPHLIAGPILHHKELMPQLDRRDVGHFRARRLALGLSIFAIGLFKKTVIADSLEPYARPIFAAAAHGGTPGFVASWGAALLYTLELYFDFSGYSDMAIGLARMIGVQLPLNFHSPYKATSVIEFWRRWHMTLSRFLRDYLYIPLGGNRKGRARRYANLMATMLLGGLWHGAGWNFVLWGGLHGLYLVVNHGWRALRRGRPPPPASLGRLLGGALTFLVVVVAWVPFRAAGFAATWVMLAGMAGLHGFLTNAVQPVLIGEAAPGWRSAWEWIAVLLPVVWLMPNTQEIFSRYRTMAPPYATPDRLPLRALALRWRLTSAWAYAMALVAAVAILYCSRGVAFIYFQF